MLNPFWLCDDGPFMRATLSDKLKQAVARKDIAAARSAILTEVRNDRTRDEPRALMLADLVSKELPGLYEPDNGVCSGQDDMAVSDELWVKARSAMMLNFSRERLCFIETIVRELCSKNQKDGDAHLPVRPSVPISKIKSMKYAILLACISVGIAAACVALAVLMNKGKSPSPVRNQAETIGRQP